MYKENYLDQPHVIGVYVLLIVVPPAGVGPHARMGVVQALPTCYKHHLSLFKKIGIRKFSKVYRTVLHNYLK